MDVRPILRFLSYLNAEVWLGLETSWSEVYELCWIPIFGGGLSFGYEEAKNMSAGERRRALRWLENKRHEEIKAFKSSSSQTSMGPRDLPLPEGIREPKLRRPPPPRRPE
jgi:hypothetical protein